MSNFCDYFNIFSRTPTLRINGKVRPTSIFGSIIGFFAISIIIAAISYILNDYFSRLTYTINSYTDQLATPDIDLKDFKLGFKLVNASGGDVPEIERLFKISALHWEFNSPKLGDNTTSIWAKPTHIPIIKCDQYRKGSLFYNDYAAYAKNFKYIDCLDFQNLGKNLTGSYGNLGRSSIINVYFQKCQNSTEQNKTDCYPDEIIVQKLAHTFMGTTSIDNDIYLDDINDPFKPFLKSEAIPLSTMMFKNYIREMSEIRLNSDNGLIFSLTEEKTKSYKFSQKREEVEILKEHANVPGTFSQINFFANGETKIYNRSYKKLFEVITQAGGFLNGIMFTGNIILYYYSTNLILWECIYGSVSSKELEDRLSDTDTEIKNAFKEDSNINKSNNVNKQIQEERKEGSFENNERQNFNSVEHLQPRHNNFLVNQNNSKNSKSPNDNSGQVENAENAENKDLNSKVGKKKANYFTFWNAFCSSSFICSKTKKDFLRLISQVIERKLSLEHLLKISSDLEILKEFSLTEEKLKKFNESTPMTFEKQLAQFDIEVKNPKN